MANTPFRKNRGSQQGTPSFSYSPAQAAPYNTPRSITAAASRMDLSNKSEAERLAQRQSRRTAMIQSAAWEYYDAIAEIKYALGMVASIVSRIRLYCAVTEDPSDPTPIALRDASSIPSDLAEAAERTLARLNSAYGGQAGLLRDAALNLNVAGECYLVQIPERKGAGLPESWDIRSVDELKVTKDGDYVILPRSDMTFSSSAGALPAGAIKLPKETAFAGRIWRAHPRFSEDPDSSLFGMLDLCEELLLLDRTFRATHRSRLNAGLLYVPDVLSSSATPDANLFEEGTEPDDSAEDEADEFEEQLLIGMSTPIEDESSASAVVPIIIRGPADLADKVKPIKLERSFDENMIQRADRVLERIMQGLDVPKDTVTGLANVKYSNAIQIDEALYKAHIEPMLLLLADAFTVMYLRPALLDLKFPKNEVDRIVVWYDPSAVATRNDRAADADSGFEKGAISYETWRRAHGFSDQDAPTQNEAMVRMVLEKGTLTPEMTEALLTVLAPEMMTAARGVNQANSVAPVPAAANDILNGGTGAPTGPGAPVDPSAPGGLPTDPTAPTAEPSTPLPTDGAAPVQPGEDAPPFDLAEPSGSASPEDEV